MLSLRRLTDKDTPIKTNPAFSELTNHILATCSPYGVNHLAIFGSTRDQLLNQKIIERHELDFLILVDKFPTIDEIIHAQTKIRVAFKTIVDLHFIPSNGLRNLDTLSELDTFKKLIMFAHRSYIIFSSTELQIPNWLAKDYSNQANLIGYIQALKLYESRRTHPQQLLKHYIYLIGGAEVYKIDKKMNFPPDKSGLLERMEQLTLDKSTLEIFKLYKKFKGTLPPKSLVSAINLKIEDHFQSNFQELNSTRKDIIKFLNHELPKPLLADLRNY